MIVVRCAGVNAEILTFFKGGGGVGVLLLGVLLGGVGGVVEEVVGVVAVVGINIFGMGMAHRNCVPSCVVIRRGSTSCLSCSVLIWASVQVSIPLRSTFTTYLAPALWSVDVPVVAGVPVPAEKIEWALLPNAARRALVSCS